MASGRGTALPGHFGLSSERQLAVFAIQAKGKDEHKWKVNATRQASIRAVTSRSKMHLFKKGFKKKKKFWWKYKKRVNLKIFLFAEI